MKPASPVVRGFEQHETTFAKDQPEYNNLPAIRTAQGQVFTRWTLTLKERLRVLFTGNIYLTLHTFNHPLQPVRLDTLEPELTVNEPA